MLTGELKNKIDPIWNAFWSGGIADPIQVIEQITYLLFLHRLDDLQTLEENKATRLKQPTARRIFPEGADTRGRAFDSLVEPLQERIGIRDVCHPGRTRLPLLAHAGLGWLHLCPPCLRLAVALLGVCGEL